MCVNVCVRVCFYVCVSVCSIAQDSLVATHVNNISQKTFLQSLCTEISVAGGLLRMLTTMVRASSMC